MNWSYCSCADVVVLLDEISSILQHISTNWKAFICRIWLQPAYFPESCQVLEYLFWDRDEQNFSQLTSSYLLFLTSNCLHVVLTDFRWESSKIHLHFCSINDYKVYYHQFDFPLYTKSRQSTGSHRASLCIYKHLKALESLRWHRSRADALSKQEVEYICRECSKMIETSLGQCLFW